MSIAIILLALALLMAAAYRGASVILFAPLAALLAVLLVDPELVLPVYSGLFMDRMVGFIKLYFPVFLLGAIFGKLMEISGFARSIIRTTLRFVGPSQAIAAVVSVCALLTYGGVSLFVVAFAVYPFAAELFRASDIPKRLIPATIALGAFTFTMDALPGSPQIQNIIPASFFHTTTWAAPWLGTIGALMVLTTGLGYLEWRRRSARSNGEGYGDNHINEPAPPRDDRPAHPVFAALPLLIVGLLNLWLTGWLPSRYGPQVGFEGTALSGVPPLDATRLYAIWAVECSLLAAILFVLPSSVRTAGRTILPGLNTAITGAMLASLNTASEYGFGAVIAALPGFRSVRDGLAASVTDPLLNVAVTSNVLAGITGSASGGMSIALGAMADTYLRQAAAAGIPNDVLHRISAMASGGMDTLPHNGAVITLLAVTGLTHRHSYRDIFALTIFKTVTAFFVIYLHYSLGIV